MLVGQARLAPRVSGAPPRPLLAQPQHEIMRWQTELYIDDSVTRRALAWIMAYGRLSYQVYEDGVHIWAKFSAQDKAQFLEYRAMYATVFKEPARWLNFHALEALR
jgi:hypothetical protein